MSALPRRGIKTAVECRGIGLHLGKQCTLRFLPAPLGHGIRFRRVDLDGKPETKAHVSVAEAAERRTQLGTGEGALHTVEHVLAAVAGMGVEIGRAHV